MTVYASEVPDLLKSPAPQAGSFFGGGAEKTTTGINLDPSSWGGVPEKAPGSREDFSVHKQYLL